MFTRRFVYSLILFLQICVGCAGADDIRDFGDELPAVETRLDPLSAPIQGAWGGGFSSPGLMIDRIEFMNEAVNRVVFPLAPAGAKHFYARAGRRNAEMVDVFGYYLETSTQIKLGSIKAGVTEAERPFVCADATCATPQSYDKTFLPGSPSVMLRMLKPGSPMVSGFFTRQGTVNLDGSNLAIVTPVYPSRVEAEGSPQILEKSS